MVQAAPITKLHRVIAPTAMKLLTAKPQADDAVVCSDEGRRLDLSLVHILETAATTDVPILL